MAESAPPLVLVTGASGFVSTWLIKELLEKGEYRVRGTVRDKSKEEKIKPLLELVPDAKFPLELVSANLTDKDCWGPAVEGCTYVFHVASPFPPPGKVDETLIISEAVGGVVNVLAACAESGTVKRVVVTSSVAAISCGMNGNPGFTDDYDYTEDDWSVEDSCSPYEKSKSKAERAGWDFVEKLEESKKFELVVVNPGYIQGPLLSKASGSGTASVAIMLLERKMPALPNLRMAVVDVRDVVAGEIAAMFTPSAAGKRFILNGGSISMKDFSMLVNNEFYGQGYNVPTGTIPKFILWGMKFFSSIIKDSYPSVNKNHTWNNERMKNDLGITPRSIEKSILDTCYSVVEFGLVAKTPGYLGPPESRNQPPAAEGEASTPADTTAETQSSEATVETPSTEANEGIESKPIHPDTDETAEPQPTKDQTPEPQPTKDQTPEPQLTKDQTPEPQPTKDQTPEPQPTKDQTPEPQPTKDQTPEPQPTKDQTPEADESTEAQPTDASTDPAEDKD